MSGVVLDSSALLAFLQGEPGAESVSVQDGEARMSAVNHAEVVAVLTRRGAPATEIRATLSSLIIGIVSFDAQLAEAAGLMIAATRPLGLSLGDRACLATAQKEGLAAVTADRSWSALDIGVPVRVIR